ncbi:MAG: hypothetical protein E6H93_03530 [Chloroflexi bacterium]|nr:MAG: hypothetical protein E6H93_03530 [Chloroflexota bacterium]
MASLLYPFALFLHIVGAFGLIASVTLEAIGLRGLRRATRADEARLWLSISRRLVIRLAPASLGTILITGLYMTAVAWGPKGWIITAFASLIALAVIGAFGTGMRMARLEPAISHAQGELADDLRRRLQDPVLLTSLRVRIAIVLGIAFLMTVKPTFIAAIAVVVLAAAIGWLTAQIPARRTGHELGNEIG